MLTFISKNIALISYALRDIFKNKVILILIVTSLSIAYSAVFLSTSILAGFQQMLVDGAQGYLGDIVVSPKDSDESIPHIATTIKQIKSHPNVAAISVRSDIVASIKYKDKKVSGYRTVGMDSLDEAQTTYLNERLIEGSWLNKNKPEQVIIGFTLADFLSGLDYDNQLISTGEIIEVTTQSGQTKTYTIGGIIDAKTFLPNLFLILPKNEIENLAGVDTNSEITIRLKDRSLLNQTIKDLEDTTSNVSITSWRDEAGYVDDIILAVAFIMGLINGLLTISVFIIMSVVIFINVFQKRRQIGIVKSMGASNTFIVLIYLLETSIYAILSYLIGFLIFWIIHQYSALHPVSMLIGDFRTVFRIDIIQRSLIALLAAAIGGSIAPSYTAARTKIVNVIRETV